MIDLRSDALSPPTAAMWRAMRRAELGWALRGEDPSVRRLEELAAGLLGKEAGLLLPTCSSANRLGLLALGAAGRPVAAEAGSHVATTELAGLAAAGVAVRTGGALAGARVLCLENSHNNAGGAVTSPERTAELAAAARAAGAAVHLDGARLLNAAVALAVPARALAGPADTVALSLNKGLCAPYGALLCGSAEAVGSAREEAHRLGLGSVHKLGALAAAGIVALETMVERLADDHARAAELAGGIGQPPPPTNIVRLETADPDGVVRRLAARGVLALARPDGAVRFVTHRGIGRDDIRRAVAAVRAALA